MERIGKILADGSDAQAIKAVNLLCEVAQIAGPRTIDRISAPNDAGMSIGELEEQIRALEGRLGQRTKAAGIVSTQLPTGGEEKH
jgi:hypothetical protein